VQSLSSSSLDDVASVGKITREALLFDVLPLEFISAMPDHTLPLDDLTQQIAQYQSELERLRQEYQTRQALLADLSQKRDQLQDQLRQVEADIQAVSQGSVPVAGAPAAPAPKPPAKKATGPTLTEALVDVAREANRAVTAKEFAEELRRRKFPTTSGNVPNLVHSHLAKLVKRGIFRRAEGRPGFVLGVPTNGTPSATAKPPAPTKKAAPRGQPTLPSLLTELLQKSRKPMAARDLAEKVLATGYQTSSKNFTGVVWTALGNLKGVENVKGQGWRLKKS